MGDWGLQAILVALERYGDIWGCCANADTSHILLVQGGGLREGVLQTPLWNLFRMSSPEVAL
jgi:hypothetical protein